MQIGITGATGFLGRHLVARLSNRGHHCRLWCRKTSNRDGFDALDRNAEWLEGALGDVTLAARLVQGCDAIVHAALDRPGPEFRGGEGDLLEFARRNVMGSLQLMEEARIAGVQRFIYLSSCAVHERILSDRPLDESHPTWPVTHYGAHKAAVEMFVHSYGWGQPGFNVCALRPTGIYGIAQPVENSKWYQLVQSIVRGEPVVCQGGGKEVHATDVAAAVDLLLHTQPDRIRGEAFACYDRYVSQYEVAHIAKRIAHSSSVIEGQPSTPQHQIVTNKLQQLGMTYGGDALLERTIAELVETLSG